jgi:hypothetical protein
VPATVPVRRRPAAPAPAPAAADVPSLDALAARLRRSPAATPSGDPGPPAIAAAAPDALVPARTGLIDVIDPAATRVSARSSAALAVAPAGAVPGPTVTIGEIHVHTIEATPPADPLALLGPYAHSLTPRPEDRR